METWTVTVLASAFIGGIFWIAIWGERERGEKFVNRYGHIIYSLSLAVYCTSWTYYGAVGTAVTQGWDYMAVYIGPILLYLFGQRFLTKLLHVANNNNVTSIADFLSARYGKRRNIALSVAMLCLFSVVPYIALQLNAVASSYQVMLGFDSDLVDASWYGDGALPSAIAMAFFAILFGTRNVHVTEQNRGIILAVAFESLIKITVLVFLAVLVYVLILETRETVWRDFFVHANERMQEVDNTSWISLFTKTFLATTAIFLLPRQFHVTFVAGVSPSYLPSARRWFTSYLVIVTVVVIPLAIAGMTMFPDNLDISDNFVLLIPSNSGWSSLTFLVFIGGFCAATSMIIIASLTLSTMLSNDVIMPIILRGKRGNSRPENYRRLLLLVRRATIASVMTLSWLYSVTFTRNYDLAETGLLTFAFMIQLAPATIGAIYWRKGNAWGVYAGLLVGVLLWLYTLMLPQLISIGIINSTIMQDGLLGYSWLNPQALFNTQLDSLSHGVLFSLGANTMAYVGVSLLASVPLRDRLQAVAFVKPNNPVLPRPEQNRNVNIRTHDLVALLERFIGSQRAHESLKGFRQQGLTGNEELSDSSNAPATSKLQLVQHVEHELTGVIGASSASTMVNAVIEGGPLDVEDVVMLFDDSSQAIQFSRKILFSTLEHLSLGVSVVDSSLNLVAWNRAYLTTFYYPAGVIQVGTPIADVIRLNAERGLLGSGNIDEQVTKRIGHLRRGAPYVYQRTHTDGRVIEIRGNPIPGGGFVTCFTDVTDYNNTVNELSEAKLYLEDRVQERTRTISSINQELMEEVERRRRTEKQLLKAKAEAEAESANISKTRFLALASHDILQPLNAARLFTGALASHHYQAGDPRANLVQQLEKSLDITEELISILLEIAQLDDDSLKPTIQPVELDELLASLQSEYQLLTDKKGLALEIQGGKGLWVAADATYLRRILQNLLSNAVKYTVFGRILLSCRKRSNKVLIQVWDTGPGIPQHELSQIFHDFYRIDATASGQPGIGLGLAIVHRMARLLGVELQVRSVPGKGSVFSLSVPLAEPPSKHIVPSRRNLRWQLMPLSVVCIDDNQANLDALETLLKGWHVRYVHSFLDSEDLMAFARENDAPDVIIIDYQLAKKQDGITIFQEISSVWPGINAILVSARPDVDLPQKAKDQGLVFLSKPLKPAALRACLQRFAFGSQQE